jgi:hypothetical protein
MNQVKYYPENRVKPTVSKPDTFCINSVQLKSKNPFNKLKNSVLHFGTALYNK